MMRCYTFPLLLFLLLLLLGRQLFYHLREDYDEEKKGSPGKETFENK
tara:strand:- start:13 stop:153 length:141 start_codon:yes stop_codon:yes gene_type:complete